ncbi:MAG TPA: hypothetical protein VH143_10340 [Kofleriaceae bacterium]|jgi:hypothetical protein|nr:hypothetical protein [Kofleriaceae bacterium]
MRRLGLLVAVIGLFGLGLACCGKSPSREPPPAPATRIPVLPDAITNRLGTIGLAVAIDFSAAGVKQLFDGPNAPATCAHDLIVHVRDAVATVGDGGWQGIVDGVPEAATRACLTLLGVTSREGSDGDALVVDLAGKQLAVRWRGDIATLRELGSEERHGEVPDVMKDQIAKVPRRVAAWLATSGLPDYKVTGAVGWLEVDPKQWKLTINADGATPTAAKAWIDTLVRGFSVALASRHVVVEGAWFDVTTVAPASAKLVATIPVDALGGSGS